MSNHLKSNYNQMIVLDVSPESANWQWLSFRIVKTKNQQVYLHQTEHTELALVPLEGAGTVQTKAGDFPLSRAGVFHEKPSVLYIPRGRNAASSVKALRGCNWGGAVKEVSYACSDLLNKSELRGGGAAAQVHSHACLSAAGRALISMKFTCRRRWSVSPPIVTTVMASGQSTDLLLPHRSGERRGAASQLSARQ